MASSHDKGRRPPPVVSGEPNKRATGRSQFLAGVDISADASSKEKRTAERVAYNQMKGKNRERERRSKEDRRK